MERKIKTLWMVEDKGEKTYWTRVGVAFENRDGSYSLELAAIPTSGKLMMRDNVSPASFDADRKAGA